MLNVNLVNFEQVDEWLKEYLKMENPQKKIKLQNLITMTCMPIVKRIAHTLARRSTDPIEDIIQIGSVGLIKAIRSFDPSVSNNFKSYATYLVTGEIRHYLRDKASVVKAPRAIQELCYRFNKISTEILDEVGEKPSDKEVAAKMEMPVTELKYVINEDRRKNIISLDQLDLQSDDEYTNWTDRIPDISYEEMQNIKEDRLLLLECLNNLEPDLKEIIDMTYFQDLSQKEISVKLGVSQMQISRKLKRALSILYDMVQERLNAV